MQKIIFIVLILVALGAAGLFFLKFKNQKDNSILVIKDEGGVMFKVEGGEYKEIGDESSIPNKSFVKTDGEGLAHVVLPDNSMISFSSNTEMQINYTPTDVDILQTLGKAWFRVQKLAGRNAFTVETDSTVATVRGTIFGVERDGGDTVYVTESAVDISEIDRTSGEKVRKNTQTLAENKQAKVVKDKTEIIDIPEDKKKTSWFRMNEILNREFRSGNPREFIKRIRESEEFKVLKEEFRNERLERLNENTLGAFDVQGFSRMLNGTGEVCSYLNSSEYEKMLTEADASRQILGAYWDSLVAVLRKAKEACSDNVITPAESLEIQKVYQDLKIEESTPNLQQFLP